MGERQVTPGAIATHQQVLSQPMLAPEDERELVLRWRDHRDEAARARLVAAHMRLCYAMAGRYVRNEEHRRDLAQEGVIGLLAALEGFDVERGVRLATWARRWIDSAIRKDMKRVVVVVDMPSRTYRRAKAGAAEGQGSSWLAQEAARGEMALDAPLQAGSLVTPLDMLSSNEPGPEQVFGQHQRLGAIHSAVDAALLGAMSPREAGILRRRDLADFPDTLDAIAHDLGLSRERVRQIEAAARKKLTKWLMESSFDRSLLAD